jgi:hypothetical protein
VVETQAMNFLLVCRFSFYDFAFTVYAGGPATMLSLNDPNKMHGQPPPAYTPRAGDYS